MISLQTDREINHSHGGIHMLPPNHRNSKALAVRIANQIISSIVDQPQETSQQSIDEMDLEIDKQNKILYCTLQARKNLRKNTF